jgi:hypothetical protein
MKKPPLSKLLTTTLSVLVVVASFSLTSPASAEERCQTVRTNAWSNGDGTYSMQETYQCVYVSGENSGKGQGYSEVYEKTSAVVPMSAQDYAYWNARN